MKYKGGEVGGVEQLHNLLHAGAYTGHFVLFHLFIQFVLHGAGAVFSGCYLRLEAVFVVFGNHLSLFDG